MSIRLVRTGDKVSHPANLVIGNDFQTYQSRRTREANRRACNSLDGDGIRVDGWNGMDRPRHYNAFRQRPDRPRGHQP